MLSKLEYCSIAQYSPFAKSKTADTFRSYVEKLKRGDSATIELLAQRVVEHGEAFPNFFGSDVVLVPTPGHAPRLQGSAWIPLMLCEAMQKAGLGGSVEEFLVRRHVVKQSRYADRDERPTAQVHYDSFVDSSEGLLEPTRLVLVDDVVSRGRTLLAGASRLGEAFPGAELRAFAAFRTKGFEEVDVIRLPFVGEIFQTSDGDANRRD